MGRSNIPAYIIKRKHYDMIWNGVKIEVKSAQLCINRATYGKSRFNCYGFTMSRRQYLKIKKEDYFWFAFVLMVKKRPVALIFLPSNRIMRHFIHYGCGDKIRIRFSVFYSGLLLHEFCDENFFQSKYKPKNI